MRRLIRLGRPRSRGQALVEFALVLIPFLVMLMGIFDLGRAIYINNSLSEAARDIARATSVHLCDNWDAGGTSSTIGNSSQTLGVIATQKTQVPGLAAASATITIDCTDVSDSPVAASECGLGPN